VIRSSRQTRLVRHNVICYDNNIITEGPIFFRIHRRFSANRYYFILFISPSYRETGIPCDSVGVFTADTLYYYNTTVAGNHYFSITHNTMYIYHIAYTYILTILNLHVYSIQYTHLYKLLITIN
jgi:hypothetical protein